MHHLTKPVPKRRYRSMQALAQKQGFLVLDGGLGTQLESMGADLHHALWSAKLLMDNPQLIQSAHEAYLRAGADVLLTSSYQASIDGFRQHGCREADIPDLFTKSVQLAQSAKQSTQHHSALIVASLGYFGVLWGRQGRRQCRRRQKNILYISRNIRDPIRTWRLRH